MRPNLVAEWRKVTTTRTFGWLLVGAGVVAAVGAFSTISATTEPPWHMTDPLHEQTLWVLATINGGIFAVIVGARVFTDEFRHSTIAHTYVADPRRLASTVGKAATAALSGALVGLAVVTALALVATLMAVLSGGEVALHARDVGPALGLVAGLALWSVLGSAFGAIVRSQVVVVAVGLIWVLMLENLGAGLLEDAGRFLPGQAVHSMAQTSEAVDGLATAPAAAVMSAYVGLFLLGALVVVRRRDIA